MTDKIKNIVNILICAVLILALSLFAWLKPADEYSDTERRGLKQFPKLNAETILNGNFMSNFEGYVTDQFPMRESFRTLKAFTRLNVFNQSDNNDIYFSNGFISEMNYPQNEKNILIASEKFRNIYETYLKDNGANVYLSIIPDKNAFLADDAGALKIDYNDFFEKLKNKTKDFATYIDIYPLLERDDYYKTDTHWRQEKIYDVAQKIASEMGVTLKAEYTPTKLDNKFHGVYYGQYALPIGGEDIYYMNNPLFDECKVVNYEKNTEIPVYNLEKGAGRDPYEMYLSGSLSLITVDNPNATSEKELIIFRDSFGSSIAPYFAEGYSRVTLVDIRYLASSSLGGVFDMYGISFENADVLFLYSTLVLNGSATLLK